MADGIPCECLFQPAADLGPLRRWLAEKPRIPTAPVEPALTPEQLALDARIARLRL